MTTNLPVRRSWRTWLPWLLSGLLAVGVVGFFAGKAALNAYLRSERFRLFVGVRTGETLNGSASFAPFDFSSSSVYSSGLEVHGSEDAAFSRLQLDGLRAEISGRRFFERVWQIEELSIERAEVRFDGERLPRPRPRAAVEKPESSGGWLPNRVEVGSGIVREIQLAWDGGKLAGTALQIAPQDGGWTVAGQGGRLTHATLPPLEIESLKLRYREPALFVQSAEMRPPSGGQVSIQGEVRPGNALELQAKLDGVSISPFLTPDWRARLHGKLAGDVRVQGPLPATRPPLITGTLRLDDGRLEALPVLDEIAAFTRTAQFRRVALTQVSGDFRHDGKRLTVSRFIAESAALIRVDGAFVVEGEQIDGAFQVGITPSSLQWLPGSQAQVFTVARDGYLWAPMRLTGPVSQPTEDLSPRLLAAAKGAVIERVETTVRDATKGVQDAAKGALDLLFGK